MSDPTATVWAATLVPRPCPVAGAGSESGHAVVWADAADGQRVQAVVVDAVAEAPTVGTAGTLGTADTDLGPIATFTIGSAS